jgi:thiol-disulfide isomerase/thioredoxin
VWQKPGRNCGGSESIVEHDCAHRYQPGCTTKFTSPLVAHSAAFRIDVGEWRSADRDLNPEALMLERSTIVVSVAGCVFFISSLRAGEQTKAQTPRERYEALVKDYEAADAAWTKSGAKIVPADPLWIKAIGKVAPEIDGEDIDGKPMKLSDYRGRVVVLVFWGAWCGPCMATIPREKAMVERLKGRPFALVGINSDSDRAKLKSVIVQTGITWRSWWDRDPLRGPIATRWDVHAWPTAIVLDAKGMIRFRGLGFLKRPDMLDEAVDSLLKEFRHSMTKDQASAFARLALKGLSKEYPNKPEHVMAALADVKPPKALHPAFYGSYDWHSSVHGHWMLVRLLRVFPDLPESKEIRSVLSEHFTQEALKGEADYFARKESKPFERPYGWAWLLKLAEELNGWDDSQAKEWSKYLRPLVDAVVARYVEFFPKQTYPIRTGVHPNTAFGLSFAHDYALASGNMALKQVVEERARNYFNQDADAPARWEPGGADFFSPTLTEADLMRRVLPPSEFRDWFKRFLPGADKGEPRSLFEPATVTDRTDPQLVHLDGLNLSRAWAMKSIGSSLPEGDPARIALLASSARHAEAALAHVASGDYAGEHWLASFAVYLLSGQAAD